MRSVKLGLFAVAVLALAGAAHGGTFKLDGAHSHIGIAVKHFGVAHMNCHFKEVSGQIDYNEAEPAKSSVEIVVKTASLDSEFPDRVDAVKSAFFLGAEEFPEITFKSKSIHNKDGKMSIVGDLTIRDVTKEVEFPFTLNGPLADPWGNPRMGIEGTLQVNRRDFGIMFDKKTKEGVPFVGDAVNITISVEAVAM